MYTIALNLGFFLFFSSLECKIEANYFILSSYFKVVPPNSFWNTNRFNSHVFLAHESQIKERTLVFLYFMNNGNFIKRRTPLEFVISNDGIHSFKRKKIRFFEKLILKRYSYPVNILIQKFKLLDNTPKYNLYIFYNLNNSTIFLKKILTTYHNYSFVIIPNYKIWTGLPDMSIWELTDPGPD